MNEELLNKVKKHFENDNFVNLIGAKLIELGEGYAKAELAIDERHLNAHGIVQGGVMFTLADLTLGAASASYGYVCVAVQASIVFLKPVKEGMILIATAKELSKGKKISNYQITIENSLGKEIANFVGVAYDKGIEIE